MREDGTSACVLARESENSLCEAEPFSAFLWPHYIGVHWGLDVSPSCPSPAIVTVTACGPALCLHLVVFAPFLQLVHRHALSRLNRCHSIPTACSLTLRPRSPHSMQIRSLARAPLLWKAMASSGFPAMPHVEQLPLELLQAALPA